jgi:hypothetical protein
MGGDADTVQAAGYSWRAGSPFTVNHLSVYRQVVDLGAPASGSFVIPGGASGDPASAHFADQFALWAAHQRIPMSGASEALLAASEPALAASEPALAAEPALAVREGVLAGRPGAVQKTTTWAPMGRCSL